MVNSFKRCVFHLDLRVQVLRFPELLKLVDALAAKGFDGLIVEWEASFPYEQHATITNRYAYTREQVSELVHYAGERGIEIIPLQQCFGHVEYILRYDRYSRLREDDQGLSQVCPCKTEACLQFFRELMEDQIRLHPSPYFHVGGDETRLLGHCPDCAEVVRKKGTGYLYATYLKEILDLVVSLGKTPMLWADIILKYPEYAEILPKEAVFIDWNYGWAFDRFGDNRVLQDKGFTFWGAPALRSSPDNYWLTCWNRHLENFRDFIPFAKKNTYEGIILTSWSTSGVYGFFKDAESHIADIIPWRRVYPLSGFNLLVGAFAKAVASPAGFDVDAFLKAYALENFGLSTEDADVLTRIIRRKRVHLAEEKPSQQEAQQSREESNWLRGFKVTGNREEWDHLLLMTRMEAHFLEFLLVDLQVQGPSFSQKDKLDLRDKLRDLQDEASELDIEFRRLNVDYLDPHELETEIKYRRYRLDDLAARTRR